MSRTFLKSAGVEVPVAVLALGFFVALVFQTVQLVRDSETLQAITISQDTPLQEAVRLHQAVEALANDISKLAQSGDANAKQVVEEMAKQHIVLNPPPPAAGEPQGSSNTK